MRTKSVAIAGKDIAIREQQIKSLKNLIPQVNGAWNEIINSDIAGVVDKLSEQIVNIFPELQGVNIEECYPSELEEFVEAWIDVNFTGLKRLFGPLQSLMNQVLPKLG